MWTLRGPVNWLQHADTRADTDADTDTDEPEQRRQHSGKGQQERTGVAKHEGTSQLGVCMERLLASSARLCRVSPE